MSAQAAQAVIDSLEFALAGQSLAGSLPVRALNRLQDGLFDEHGEIRFEIRGGQDARRRPVLTLEISGVLHLRCQRCLGVLDHELRIANELLLVEARADTSGLDDEDAEWIEAGSGVAVVELVEDEILLSLPYAPRHGEGQCPHPGNETTGGGKAAAFEKLAALKRNGTRY